MVIYQDGVCAEVNEYLMQLERNALATGAISGPLVITRGIHCEDGTSGDTHCPGAAGDIASTNVVNADALVWLGRNGGAAMFERPAIPGTWPWHIHFVLVGDTATTNDVRHDAGGRYQVGALNAGYNGLGAGGRGGMDDGPRDGVQWPLRTWQEGIRWLKRQEDDMFENEDRKNLNETETVSRRTEKRVGGTPDQPSVTRLLIDLTAEVASLKAQMGSGDGGAPTAKEIADEILGRIGQA